MSEFREIDLTENQYARAFDGVDWHLVLYENGKKDYDETIRAIIKTVVSIARGPKQLRPPVSSSQENP